MSKILTGNTFPFALVKRDCKIRMMKKEQLDMLLSRNKIASFWGHSNTIDVVKEEFNIDVSPKKERPQLSLSEENLPVLDGEEYGSILVISPEYKESVGRPSIKEEVSSDMIRGWTIKLVTFQPM